ncbi:hypothetical protein [Devosia naphthalenivorans]|uniref:hypothetical protein n=1 Tax=Devosia naphthalenivorans TaxID=2082392 RepID=UPI000D34FAF6|nr:hypothetical protein [Devosia naphthalenivorans]
MSSALLPPDSGPATVGYADMWDSWSLYGPLIGTIKNYGIYVTPDDWVPWFIWDYGLEDVVPYVRDYLKVLTEGPAWQRTRGTPAGISIGIGWVGSAGVVAASDQRHNWWEFQVAFDAPASDIDQISQLDGIIRLSKASEDELFRMFSPGHDFRPARMDLHRFDEGLMDAYSGIPLWENGPIVSFGWAGSEETAFDNELQAGAQVTVSGETWWLETLRLDVDRLGSAPPSIIETDLELEHTAETDLFARDVWPNVWPESWAAAAQPHTEASSWETT